MQRLLELVPIVQRRDRPQRRRQRRHPHRRAGPAPRRGRRAPLQPQPRDRPVVLPAGRHHPHLGRAPRHLRAWCASYGMELCCGALLGMGEIVDQRIELLAQLRDLDPAEVPAQLPQPAARHAARRRAGRRAARGHPLDRPVPPGAARRSSCATPAAARSPCASCRRMGMTVGHQRPDRRQLPHHAGPLARGGPADARRPQDAIGALSKVI